MNTPLTLIPFPSPFAQTGNIRLTWRWMDDGGLQLDYHVNGFPQLRLPAAGPAQAADGLWQHTCCEAFIASPDTSAYREFNFSPSGAWAVYDFTDYRQARPFVAEKPPTITVDRSSDGFLLSANVDRSLLPGNAPLQLGITCVIELTDNSKQYWALHHAAPQPDFHQRNSFTLTLAPP